jgi:uncharacterized protein YraI
MSRPTRLMLGPILAVSATVIALGASVVPAFANTAATVEVDSGWLNVRSGPSTGNAIIDRLRDGMSISIICQQSGQYINAGAHPTAQWDKLAEGRFISHAYIQGANGIASCSAPTPPPPPPPSNPPPSNPPSSSGGTGTVYTEGGPLNVRSGPSRASAVVATIPNGTSITLVCQLNGQEISGAARTSAQWDRLSDGTYVSHAYISSTANIPACTDGAPAGPLPGPVGSMTNAEFIAASVAPAQQSYREFGVPASVTIAQAIVESGWGRSGLTANDRNFFGIKCFDDNPGPIANGCHTYRTTECDPTCHSTSASFRTYASATDSFRDHGRFLTVNSRYQPAFAYTHDANQFLNQIWRAGYATSPTYYTDLTRIMGSYNLYQYDLP